MFADTGVYLSYQTNTIIFIKWNTADGKIQQIFYTFITFISSIWFCKGQKINLNKYKVAPTKGLEKEIKEIVKSKKGLTVQAYMGIIMQKYRGKISGQEAMKILKKLT